MRLLQKFCKLPPAKEPSSNLFKLTQYVVENVMSLRTLKNFSSWDSELRGLPFKKMIPCPEKRSVKYNAGKVKKKNPDLPELVQMYFLPFQFRHS